MITGIDARTGEISARLDAAAGAPGREVTWSATEFQGFRHGYAGTIYKGQGKTLDHTYLLHTHHWRAAASYVALTRQRESAQVFVSTETAGDARQLARQMGRGEVRAASVAWATADELRAVDGQEAVDAPRPAARPETVAPVPRSDRERVRAFWDELASVGAGKVHGETAQPVMAATAASTEREKAEGGWLIPPYADPSGQGRDSLGRGAGLGEVAAVVAADKAVQREREARWSYLQGAYRDPHTARTTLDELVKRQGWTSAASRVAANPLQLGELRGKDGFFAGAKARAERDAAQRAVGAIGPSLERIGAAEARAERGYRTGVETPRAADATGIPRLSAAAEAAIGAVAAAKDDRIQGEAWRAVQQDKQVAGELRAFGAAAEQRFGAEGLRTMLRAGGRPGAVTAASVVPEQRPELDRVAGLTVALKAGERAGAAAAQRETASERQGQRRGLRM